MHLALKSIELTGFKSFGKKSELIFGSAIAAIVGPNGSGKCVTGDTLLRRLGTDGREEDVRIDEVRTGDLVRSYDEAAQSFVFARVKALIDSGIKDIIEIETEGGHTIRTTDNHPYLTGFYSEPHAARLRLGIFIDDANMYHAAKKAGWQISVRALSDLFASFAQVECVRYHVATPQANDPTYERSLTHLRAIERDADVCRKPLKYIRNGKGGIDKKGDVDVDLSIDVIEHLDRIDVAVVVSGDSDYVPLARYAAKCGKGVVFLAYKGSMAWELRLKRHLFAELVRPLIERTRNKQNNNPEPKSGAELTKEIIHAAYHASRRRGVWKRVEQLQPGDRIAIDDGGILLFDRISQKKQQGKECVWDVSIDGTHNFVGNGIVAHNSNVAEGFRFVLGEQSMKSMRSRKGEDLIWGGSPALGRLNRASVKVVFDNSKRLLDIDFKEVHIERIVYRDGQNEYLMNGTQVRLKDVVRLLAGANIGGSGYQIISQGEADRILNASPRERREMVEDALGLKLYQHKKAESERKLEETANNIEKTKSLRREIAPHLNFLRTQVHKIEKARELREELVHKLSDYLAREHAWITQEDARLRDDARAHEEELKQLTARLREASGQKEHSHRDELAAMQAKVRELEGKLGQVRARRAEYARELGRAEGALEATNVTVEAIVPVPHVRGFVRDIDSSLEEVTRQEDLGAIRTLLGDVRHRISAFVEGLSGTAPATNEEVRRDVERLTASLKQAEGEEAALATDIEMARAGIVQSREASFAAERKSVEIEGKIREVRAQLDTLNAGRLAVSQARQRFEEEVREGIALVGAAVHAWDKNIIPEGALSEERTVQEKRRREIERLKIKIEDSGLGNGDQVIREFTTTKERDEFLARELDDLERSAVSLKELIVELEKTIDVRFTEGLKHINEALAKFFEKLFGGGECKLKIEQPRKTRVAGHGAGADEMEDEEHEDDGGEEEELYAGLSVSVSLPRKKIRGLEVLSGGERALTSIALIFSMTQVNPPPFIILDETDAALDEANSKRYADMIRELGQRSQLIVITHNRATMAAAGELFGVTMGQDGVSKLLSVKLEEAQRVAK